MMIESVARYFQRSWQLGPRATLHRLRLRIMSTVSLWSESVWWGFRARRKMSDAALLARTTGAWRSVDALLEHLASRPASSFMLPHDSPGVIAGILDRYFPGYFSAVVAAADACCRNELSLLRRAF